MLEDFDCQNCICATQDSVASPLHPVGQVGRVTRAAVRNHMATYSLADRDGEPSQLQPHEQNTHLCNQNTCENEPLIMWGVGEISGV